MPTTADTSSVSVYYRPEVTWGTVDAGNVTPIRITSAALQHQKRTIESQEINAKRNVGDLIEVASNANGPIGFELSYTTFDALLASLFASDWVNSTTVAGAFTISGTVPGAGTITKADSLSSYVIGQWVRLTGCTNAANNGFHRISGITGDDTITVASTLVNETSPGGASLSGSYLRNSNTKKSVTLWKHFADINKWWRYTGMRPGRLELNVASAAIVNGSIAFEGADGNYLGSAPTLDTGNTNPVLNATANVGTLYEGDYVTPVTVPIQSITLAIENNLRAQSAVANKTAIGIGYGMCAVTGAINAYLVNETYFTKYRSHTSTSLSWRLSEGDAATLATALTKNTLIFTIPTVKFGGGGGGNASPTAPGKDQDVIQSIPFQGVKTIEGAAEYTIQIDRFAAA